MYKISFALLLIAVACAAIPVDLDTEDAEYEVAPRADRHSRATCDLLSASVKGITLNHAACAAHCLVIGNGNRGGRCINGVCHCRK